MSDRDSSTPEKKPALATEVVQTMAKEAIDAVFKKVIRNKVDDPKVQGDGQNVVEVVKDNTPILQEMERCGLVNVSGMDENNKKAWDVLENKGTEAAVQFMFKHPYDKDPTTGEGRSMSYAEMRSFYG